MRRFNITQLIQKQCEACMKQFTNLVCYTLVAVIDCFTPVFRVIYSLQAFTARKSRAKPYIKWLTGARYWPADSHRALPICRNQH